MKKTESQKIGFYTSLAGNGSAHPTVPANIGNRDGRQPSSDPSSSFRSSRYPVPQFEFRTQAAR
jgi:hypothetical protein